MPNITTCPKCKADIEDDSWFCDQCGTELFICPSCHTFGKGKWCTNCGKGLVPAKQFHENERQNGQSRNTAVPKQQMQPSPISAVKPQTYAPQQDVPAGGTLKPSAPSQPKPGHLVGAGVRLGIADGVVIGRTNGHYVQVFGNYGYVSGTHARLQQNAVGDWEVVDLGSTNGTFVNGQQLAPNVPMPFHVGDCIRFATLDFEVLP